MELPLTLALAAALLLLAVGCGWRGAQPPDPTRGPRLVPWRFLMLLAAAGFMLAATHAVNLLGFTTGPQP